MSKTHIKSVKVVLNKNARGRIYQYNDDNASVYFEGIKVTTNSRRKGFGTELLQILEFIGKCLGATYSYLWVKKDTWMYDWYRRNGYDYFKDHDVEDFVWMEKCL